MRHVTHMTQKALFKCVLQCVAVCCSVLQCVAVCFSVLQCVVGWINESCHTCDSKGSVLQCVEV